MNRVLAVLFAIAMLSPVAGSVMAQGAPTPKTAADCKSDEVWDATTRTCKPKS